VEPFFYLNPKIALLSDINADLVNTYYHVKNSPKELIQQLQHLPVDTETYSRFRRARPTYPLEQAVRFLYLNRTAFGGMYRVNQEGHFNVPFGGGQRTPEILWRDGLLLAAAKVLSRATVYTADFEAILDETGAGDLVYCDPTFTVAHNQNGFIRYNERNFSWHDQLRLAQACHRARERGACILISNAFHHEIAALYPDAQAIVVTRMSVLCPDPAKRHLTQEYLFLLHPDCSAEKNHG
jgi:DNA adenine methylase